MDEVSKSISTWIKERREEKHLSLTELGQITGLTQAQLSRIETGASSVTLFTLIRVFFALDLSFTSLTSENLISNDYPIARIFYQKDPSYFDFPTFKLVELEEIVLHFIGEGRHIKVLKKWLANFLVTQRGRDQEQTSDDADILLYEITLPTESRDPNFSSVAYPNHIDIEIFEKLYLSGGAFIFHDAGAYLKSARIAKGLSLRQVSAKIGFTHPGLARLENQLNTRVKFIDLLNLDRALDLGGDLIAIAWRVGELYLGTARTSSYLARHPQPYTQAQIEWIETLIFMQRIFQNDDMNVATFVQEVRSLSIPNIPHSTPNGR